MSTALPDEHERFRERYQLSGDSALIAAEIEVLGSDYQANGYTTMAQADDLGSLLRLDDTSRLLDIGSGCGWPGIYLAKKHHCEVVTLDPVDQGMLTAVERARHEGIKAHMGVLARGTALPFVGQSFDAVVHTDVVC